MREKKREDAYKHWDEIEAFVKWAGISGMGEYLEIYADHGNRSKFNDIVRAKWSQYHQETKERLEKVVENSKAPSAFMNVELENEPITKPYEPGDDSYHHFVFWFDIPKPGTTREKYGDDRAMDVLTHGFIGLDGKWNEDGDMGYWGMQLTENAGFPEIYEAWVMQMQAEHPDAVLTVLDCHI